MIVLKTINARQGLDGRTYVMANIQSDDTPEPMPKTGAGIEGVSNDAALDIGSRLYVLNTSTEYVLGEDWNWYEWRTASGGGGGDTDNLVESISSAVTPGEDFDTYTWSYTRGNGTKVPIITQQVPNRVGADGSTTTPHVTQDAPDRATISWTNDQGEPVPDPVTIIAPQGEKGEAGRDGFDPVIEPTATEDGYNLLIITADGQHEIDLHNGGKGEPGVSAGIMTERFPPDEEAGLPGRAVITTRDEQGTTESAVYDGRDGRDGVDGSTPDITITATQDGKTVPVTKSGEGAAQAFAFAFAGSGDGNAPYLKNVFKLKKQYGDKERYLCTTKYPLYYAFERRAIDPTDLVIIHGWAKMRARSTPAYASFNLQIPLYQPLTGGDASQTPLQNYICPFVYADATLPGNAGKIVEISVLGRSSAIIDLNEETDIIYATNSGAYFNGSVVTLYIIGNFFAPE